ncbi:MAG TPA: DUF2510 domain-containing protein, partial [Pseudolysinimonas sp.]|nr:DUF2510 domain-containing protein [Pseudolysinimonas sp.]
MSSTLMTEPAAGWYRDPADAGAWRWWDGATWTGHIRPVEEALQTAPVVIEPVVIEPVPTHPPFFAHPVAPAPQPAPVAEPVTVAEPA